MPSNAAAWVWVRFFRLMISAILLMSWALNQDLVGIDVPEIGVHIAGTLLYFHILHFAPAHSHSSFAICSAAFNRSPINSMSCLGVATPVFDFF